MIRRLSPLFVLLCAAPAFAGGIGCDVTLDRASYAADGKGQVEVVVTLKRPDFDCSTTAFAANDPQRIGPVLELQRRLPDGSWGAVQDAWRPADSQGRVQPSPPRNTEVQGPFRLDWGCSLSVPRVAALPPGTYRVRVAMTAPHAPDHTFRFASKPFTVTAAQKGS